jgi:hypothetical protein
MIWGAEVSYFLFTHFSYFRSYGCYFWYNLILALLKLNLGLVPCVGSLGRARYLLSLFFIIYLAINSLSAYRMH